MDNKEFEIILKHINLMIDKCFNADDVAEAFDQIQNLIEFYLHIIEEEE